MKKIKVSTTGINIHKEKIHSLTSEEMKNVNGGFTYSLSTGAVCRASKGMGAGNSYDCGLKLGSLAVNFCEVTP